MNVPGKQETPFCRYKSTFSFRFRTSIVTRQIHKPCKVHEGIVQRFYVMKLAGIPSL